MRKFEVLEAFGVYQTGCNKEKVTQYIVCIKNSKATEPLNDEYD
ncbi:hypothetical protein [Anaerosalibacter sp. Marseille-P3206]|nr:hypothetical protein [Anaerosalibacter sp. Marseille-P3206]